MNIRDWLYRFDVKNLSFVNTSPDYDYFLEEISSLPCYTFADYEAIKDHLDTINLKDIKTITTNCSDRVRKSHISPLEDQYFLTDEDPDISLYCRFRLKVKENKSVLVMYGYQLSKSICIVGLAVIAILSILDVGLEEFN